MAGNNGFGKSEIATNLAHLVLEQRAQGFHQIKLKIIRQPPHVVVALDDGGACTATTFDNIRIQRSLNEILDFGAPTVSLRH